MLHEQPELVYFANAAYSHVFTANLVAPVDSVDSLRSALDVLKNADALVLQVERLGSLHYVALETEK